MTELNYSTTINASPEKVWNTMLNDETYRQWTKAFHPTSRYEGEWKTGSEMKFLGTGDDGKIGGMYSIIKECSPHQYISIEHRGMIADGKIDTESEEVKKWTPAYENYTFKEKDGYTELVVEIQTDESYQAMFDTMWKKALKDLKEMCEK